METNVTKNPCQKPVFAFQFATPKVFGAGALILIFSREIRPEKKREIFDIFQSHNKLSARHLQIDNYLQLTIGRLWRSDWQFFIIYLASSLQPFPQAPPPP
jgi:hypothetical protein